MHQLKQGVHSEGTYASTVVASRSLLDVGLDFSIPSDGLIQYRREE